MVEGMASECRADGEWEEILNLVKKVEWDLARGEEKGKGAQEQSEAEVKTEANLIFFFFHIQFTYLC